MYVILMNSGFMTKKIDVGENMWGGGKQGGVVN